MRSIRKISVLGFLVLIATVSSLALAQNVTETPAMTEEAMQPNFSAYDQLKWQPCAGLDGCDMALVHGDQQTGSSQVFWRVQPYVQIPAHWNTSPEHVIGVAGEMVFIDADGNKQSVKTGDYLYSPSKAVKSVTCVGKEACVIFEYDELPFDFNPAN